MPATNQHSICLILFHIHKACELRFKDRPHFSDAEARVPHRRHSASERQSRVPGPVLPSRCSSPLPAPPVLQPPPALPHRNMPVRREGFLHVKSRWLVVLDPAGPSCSARCFHPGPAGGRSSGLCPWPVLEPGLRSWEVDGLGAVLPLLWPQFPRL